MVLYWRCQARAVKGYAVAVEREIADRPDACALDAPAFRLREVEFRIPEGSEAALAFLLGLTAAAPA